MWLVTTIGPAGEHLELRYGDRERAWLDFDARVDDLEANGFKLDRVEVASQWTCTYLRGAESVRVQVEPPI
jgi:hypothetical protein